MSKRYDNGLQTDADGHWWAPLVVSGSWVGAVGAGGEVRIDFDPPIRTDVPSGEWSVLAQYGAASSAGDLTVEARDRDRDHMLLTTSHPPGTNVRINCMVSIPQQGTLDMAQQTPKYQLPITEPGDTADHPAYSADLTSRLETVLDGKANLPAPNANVVWLPAPYNNAPVTVWNHDPGGITNPPSNGSVIQLQWMHYNWPADKVASTLRAHIDAPPVAPGKGWFDLAPAHDQPIATATGPMDSAVMSYDYQHLSILVLGSAPVLAMNGANLGTLQITPPSSARIKTVDTKAVPDCAGMVAAVDPVTFTYNESEDVPSAWAGTRHYGFLAEDVEAAAAAHNLPDTLVTRDGDGKPDGLSDRDLIAVLWGAVQDLQAELATLKGNR